MAASAVGTVAAQLDLGSSWRIGVDPAEGTELVTGAPTPWAYTIGLAGGFAHPELIVVGTKIDVAGALLNEAAELVSDGARLWAGERLAVQGIPVELIDVHRDHFDRYSTFNMWWNYYGASGSPEAEPRALQLRLPDEMFCACHRQPRLDQKGSSVGHVMNRSWRRAEERKRLRGRGRPPPRE